MPRAYPEMVRQSLAAAPGVAGDLTLGAAVSGYAALKAAHDGATVNVSLRDGQAWEVRRDCVYDHDTLTLTRGTLVDSSTGAAVDLGAGTVMTVARTGYETALTPRVVLDGGNAPIQAEDGLGHEYGLIIMEPGGGLRVQAGADSYEMSKSPPRTLFRNKCPVGIANSGSIGANGALTLGNPIYSSFVPTEGVWLYFPAEAVYSGSPAGFYWTKFSTDSLGTVYANYTASATGTGAPPAVLTPLSGTTGAAYTGWTGSSSSYLTVFDVSPDIEMAPGDALQLVVHPLFNNSDAAVNSKWMRVTGNTDGEYLLIRPYTSGTSRGYARDGWLHCYDAGRTAYPQGWTDTDCEYGISTYLSHATPRFRLEIARTTATDYFLVPRFSVIHWPAAE